MQSKHLWILMVLIVSTSVFAQSQFQAGAHFTIGYPQKEFSDNLDVVGFGGGGSFLFRLPNTPVSIGAGLDFYIYGSETRQEPWSKTIPDVYMDVSRTNSIFQGFLMMRLQPSTTPVTPYADGLLGFNYLVTSTSVKDQSTDEEIASSTNFDDAAFCYGGGAGLLIRVFEGETDESDYAIDIDLGFRYLNGGEAEYLKKGDIEIENGKVFYYPNESRTDLVTVIIGVNFHF
ncbi:hypothetical protein ACFL4L_05385 [bacterium]